MSRALERQSPLEWKFIILLYKYVARDDVQDVRWAKEKKEKKKERKRSGGRSEGDDQTTRNTKRKESRLLF